MLVATVLGVLLSTQPVADEPLTLEESVAIAVEYANDMIQAREDVLLVDADYATAVSAIMPRLDVSFTAGQFYYGNKLIENRNVNDVIVQEGEPPEIRFGDWRDTDPNSRFFNTQWGLQISATQLIYDGDRWWYTIEQADDRLRGSKASLQAMTNLIRARVARAFFGVESALKSLEIIQAQVGVDEAQVERADALLRVGRGAPNDLATAKRNLAGDQISMVNAETILGQARRTFNLTLGRSPNTPVLLVMPVEVTSSTVAARYVPDLERLFELTKDHRPDLVALRANLDAARKQVGIARADYYPSLSFGARYNRNSRRFDRVINDPTENFTATFEFILNWNVMDGFATTTNVERAQVNLRKEEAAFKENERQILAEVEDSLQRYRNQQRAHAYARQQFEAAQEAVRLARGLYEAGRGTSLELRDAQLGLTRARIAITNARLEQAIAYADLVSAVGTSEWATR